MSLVSTLEMAAVDIYFDRNTIDSVWEGVECSPSPSRSPDMYENALFGQLESRSTSPTPTKLVGTTTAFMAPRAMQSRTNNSIVSFEGVPIRPVHASNSTPETPDLLPNGRMTTGQHDLRAAIRLGVPLRGTNTNRKMDIFTRFLLSLSASGRSMDEACAHYWQTSTGRLSIAKVNELVREFVSDIRICDESHIKVWCCVLSREH